MEVLPSAQLRWLWAPKIEQLLRGDWVGLSWVRLGGSSELTKKKDWLMFVVVGRTGRDILGGASKYMNELLWSQQKCIVLKKVAI